MGADAAADAPLDAGDFGAWIVGMQGALDGERDSVVPCDGCTACCTSAQFVHIGPDEVETLARIPAALLFPAPRLPRGHVLMGYDERGHCPMLVDNRCSIYEHRPATCRTYDCRVFPAAEVEVEEGDKALIAQRARRWRFTFASPADRVRRAAVAAAAAFVREHRDAIPKDRVPSNATQLAVLAIAVHEAFLRGEETDQVRVVDPEPHAIRLELERRSASG